MIVEKTSIIFLRDFLTRLEQVDINNEEMLASLLEGIFERYFNCLNEDEKRVNSDNDAADCFLELLLLNLDKMAFPADKCEKLYKKIKEICSKYEDKGGDKYFLVSLQGVLMVRSKEKFGLNLEVDCQQNQRLSDPVNQAVLNKKPIAKYWLYAAALVLSCIVGAAFFALGVGIPLSVFAGIIMGGLFWVGKEIYLLSRSNKFIENSKSAEAVNKANVTPAVAGLVQGFYCSSQQSRPYVEIANAVVENLPSESMELSERVLRPQI